MLARLTGAFANVASGATLTTTDGYARFTVLYAASSAVSLTALQIVDTDSDGVPDWYEDQNGLNRIVPDATTDLDGDGQSNLEEYLAGTVANNPNSALRVLAITPEAANVRILWTTVGGRSYRVQTNALSGGTYTTNFVDLSPLISVPGTGESTTNYLHTGDFTNDLERYYRVRLGP